MSIQNRTSVHAPDRARIFRMNAIALAIASALACWPGLGRASKHTSVDTASKVHKSAQEAKQGTEEARVTKGAPRAEWAMPWDKNLDARAYALSEKLDGVRALWDGKKLRFRSGREIAAPAWFLAALPSEPLDGELWMGRGTFDRLSGAVRKAQPVDEERREVRYMVFDAPLTGLSFRQRYQRAQDLLSGKEAKWLLVVAQAQVATAQEVPERLQNVVAQGGEGLVLHHWDALWQPGRSKMLRKLKPEPDDEGRVLAVVPGKGKLKGQMGGLLLETSDKKRFTLGTGFSEAVRRAPPAPGSWITFRYRDRTPKGIPRFASFLRVRPEE
jgi:DNA ligase-1